MISAGLEVASDLCLALAARSLLEHELHYKGNRKLVSVLQWTNKTLKTPKTLFPGFPLMKEIGYWTVVPIAWGHLPGLVL